MPGVQDLAAAFREFCDHLTRNELNKIKQLSRLTNGYEGWLKIEFALWLESAKGLAIGKGVGVEYSAALVDNDEEMDRQSKRCDLWLSGGEDVFHYVEFKVLFNNRNKNKMLQLAGWDFWYMARLDANSEQAASGNLVVLGNGFEPDAWKSALQQVSSAAGVGTDTAIVGQLPPDISWAVWSKTY